MICWDDRLRDYYKKSQMTFKVAGSRVIDGFKLFRENATTSLLIFFHDIYSKAHSRSCSFCFYISWKSSSGWNQLVFHFGTENRHFEKKDPETGKFKWDGMAAAIKTFCEMGQICRINGYIALLGPTCGTPWVNSACTGTWLEEMLPPCVACVQRHWYWSSSYWTVSRSRDCPPPTPHPSPSLLNEETY